MDTFSDDGEESEFFDALEHIAQEPDVGSDVSSSENLNYELWTSIPQKSVGERRRQFIRWMLNPDDESSGDARGSADGSFFIGDIYRIMEDNGAVLRTSGIGDGFSSSISSLSSWNADDLEMSHGVDSNEINMTSNCGTELGMMHNDSLGEVWASGSSGEFETQSSPLPQQLGQREIELHCDAPTVVDKLMGRWLNRWRSLSCININMVDEIDDVVLDCFSHGRGKKTRKVKVQHCREKLKELSGLFAGQNIRAHEGSILTMKFSLDGQYLASAGEDKTVKVWQVVEDERSRTIDIPDADPSCVYFSMNHLSELAPCRVEKDKFNKSMGLRKTPDSACIVFPQKVFRILEEPLHIFQGHGGETLDISWSKNNYLLSSSVDKTVRLWKVGVDHCLKVFYHTDYVTCIQFNPVNDDFFISGSIDGKVRMWTISGSQVIDWTETRDIVTAVSFRPDAQGGIIGCITGTCHVFNVSDNHFQMESRMSLVSNKKSPCKRIIGFQFLPHDPRKILVTSADSQVRIIDGVNVIEKYKGLRNACNQVSASFTSCGKHIVSASNDSNIYIWKYNSVGESSVSQPKVVRSFEFFSADASVAVTWPGLKSNTLHGSSLNSLPFLSSTGISLSQEFPSDSNSNSKASATWPEEKLPVSIPQALVSSMSKSEYRLFRACCQSSAKSHAWGLVLVTAGWDGRIRSFHNYGLPIPL